MPSRYRNKATFINNSELYENLFFDKRVKFIEQYKTYTLHHIDITENSSLSVINHTWKLGDRFYKLAYKYYGDSEMWWVIAWYNGTPTEAHLTVGDVINIPTPLWKVRTMLGV